MAIPEWRKEARAGQSLAAAQAQVQSPKPKVQGPEAGGMPSTLGRSLAKILRPQAAYRWLLPQLAAITPQYIEMTLRGALAGNHVQAWELFDLMEDSWPRLSKNANQLKLEVVQEMKGWRARPYQEEDETATDSAKERARVVNAALKGMRPNKAADENGFGDTIYDLMDAWLKGQVVVETDWEAREAGAAGTIIAPRATFWVHPTCVAWSMEGVLGLRLELARGAATLSPGVWAGTSYQPMPSSVAAFPDDKFLIGICKAKSGTALGGARLRALAWWWCAQNFSADWLLNLAQLWQLPFRWANYDPNAPQGTIDSICEMLENMGSNAWAAFPAGTTIELKESKASGGNGPADNMMDRADKNCDLLILGQTLTSDSPNSGGGTRAQGEVHERVEEKIMLACCEYVADVLNLQLVPSILRLNYGDESERPEFCGSDEEPGTLEFKRAILTNWSQHATLSAVMANLTDLKGMVRDSGLPVNEEAEDPWVPVRDSAGQLVSGDTIKDPEGDVIGAKPQEAEPQEIPKGEVGSAKGAPGDGKEVEEPKPGKPKPGTEPAPVQAQDAGEPSEELQEAGTEAYARALAHDLQVVAEECEALLKIQDDRVLAQRSVGLADKLDKIKEDILALPKSAQALAETMIAALMTGLTEKSAGAKVAAREGGLEAGDVPGHEFHGNQWTGSMSGGEVSRRLKKEYGMTTEQGKELMKQHGLPAGANVLHKEAAVRRVQDAAERIKSGASAAPESSEPKAVAHRLFTSGKYGATHGLEKQESRQDIHFNGGFSKVARASESFKQAWAADREGMKQRGWSAYEDGGGTAMRHTVPITHITDELVK